MFRIRTHISVRKLKNYIENMNSVISDHKIYYSSDDREDT